MDVLKILLKLLSLVDALQLVVPLLVGPNFGLSGSVNCSNRCSCFAGLNLGTNLRRGRGIRLGTVVVHGSLLDLNFKVTDIA